MRYAIYDMFDMPEEYGSQIITNQSGSTNTYWELGVALNILVIIIGFFVGMIYVTFLQEIRRDLRRRTF